MDKLRAKRTLEQQIAEANNRLAGLKARQKKQETRVQMIVGKAVLELAENDPNHVATLLAMLEQAKLRPNEERDLNETIERLRERVTSGRASIGNNTESNKGGYNTELLIKWREKAVYFSVLLIFH